jgi:uncharacterized membrane-anchored protein YjiN (DUF445 family)
MNKKFLRLFLIKRKLQRLNKLNFINNQLPQNGNNKILNKEVIKIYLNYYIEYI